MIKFAKRLHFYLVWSADIAKSGSQLGYISLQKDSDGEEAGHFFETGPIVEDTVDGRVDNEGLILVMFERTVKKIKIWQEILKLSMKW